MGKSNELFNYLIHNPKERGWHFGSGNPEFWKYKDKILVPDGKALDLGFGIGRSSLILALNGMNVDGYDLDGELVRDVNKMAKKMSLPIKAKKADVSRVDLGREKYDTVVADQLFIHFSSKKEALNVLDKAVAATKKGGHLWVRALGKQDSHYADYQRMAENGSWDVEIVNDDIVNALCNCSGEVKMEPHLFFGQTDIMQFLSRRGMRFVHTEQAPKDYVQNIMFGEDWDNPASFDARNGAITILAEKR